MTTANHKHGALEAASIGVRWISHFKGDVPIKVDFSNSSCDCLLISCTHFNSSMEIVPFSAAAHDLDTISE